MQIAIMTDALQLCEATVSEKQYPKKNITTKIGVFMSLYFLVFIVLVKNNQHEPSILLCHSHDEAA